MSFAALLGGENHAEAPQLASRLIRRYAIGLNDSLPAEHHQSLKPLAPRIVGAWHAGEPWSSDRGCCSINIGVAAMVARCTNSADLRRFGMVSSVSL
jgi:hypothetical protein